MRKSIAALLIVSAGCSSDPGAAGSRTGPPSPASPGSMAAGSGSGSAGAAAEPTSGFGNAPAGTVTDAEPIAMPAQRACNPGLYLGSYSCELDLAGLVLPLEGDVSFNLSVNESVMATECVSNEFCADLVIEENSGTLFGLAGFYGFETVLDGALDCTTGEFRATGIGGKWGAAISTDPNDPNALWTVEDPPVGMFDGDLAGKHESGATETIEGTWNLVESESAITCVGPFRVELQP